MLRTFISPDVTTLETGATLLSTHKKDPSDFIFPGSSADVPTVSALPDRWPCRASRSSA
ncbi:hypothetical protein [Azospirillum palustre]